MMNIKSLCSVLAILSAYANAAPIDRNNLTDINLSKRSNTIEIPLAHYANVFFAPLKVGSQKETVYVTVDTGSEHLWLPDSLGKQPSSYITMPAQYNPKFDSSKSTSLKKLNDAIEVYYGDGTYATGKWATDAFTIGGQSINDVNFGLADEYTAGAGVMGLGYSSCSSTDTNCKPNLPALLKSKNIISSNSYSLSLAEKGSATSSVLTLGGYSDSLSIGKMATVLIDTRLDDDFKKRLLIKLDQWGFGGSPLVQDVYALVDSGYSSVEVPTPLFEVFAQGQKTFTNKDGERFIEQDCDADAVLFDSFEFKFGSTTIRVPLSYFVVETQLTKRKFCYLSLSERKQDNLMVLGVPFLRAATAHFDLEKNQIGFAQSKQTYLTLERMEREEARIYGSSSSNKKRDVNVEYTDAVPIASSTTTYQPGTTEPVEKRGLLNLKGLNLFKNKNTKFENEEHAITTHATAAATATHAATAATTANEDANTASATHAVVASHSESVSASASSSAKVASSAVPSASTSVYNLNDKDVLSSAQSKFMLEQMAIAAPETKSKKKFSFSKVKNTITVKLKTNPFKTTKKSTKASTKAATTKKA